MVVVCGGGDGDREGIVMDGIPLLFVLLLVFSKTVAIGVDGLEFSLVSVGMNDL